MDSMIAYCGLACDKLKKHFSIDPGARERLEEIHKGQK